MKPLYIIVHDPGVRPTILDIVLGFNSWHQFWVGRELSRIRREEDFIKVEGSSNQIPVDLPVNRDILVCGSYLEICVVHQCKALIAAGYNASIHERGSEREQL